jgi:hypothetical protein
MKNYLKEYLQEIGEIELLLTANKLLQIKAAKTLQKEVRKWLERRRRQNFRSYAVTNIARRIRGQGIRSRVLRAKLHLDEKPALLIPYSCRWSMLVMLNMVRQGLNLPLLTMDDGAFEVAPYAAIRLADLDETPNRMSALTQVFNYRQHVLLRPVRNNRFDCPWDGPLHKIVGADDPSLPEGTRRAFRLLTRRRIATPASDVAIFKESCTTGDHPLLKPPEKSRPSNLPAHMSLDVRIPENSHRLLHEYEAMSRQMGGRPFTGPVKRKLKAEEGQRRCYRGEVFLNAPLVKVALPNPLAGARLIGMLCRFNTLVQQLSQRKKDKPTGLEEITFLTELHAIRERRSCHPSDSTSLSGKTGRWDAADSASGAA